VVVTVLGLVPAVEGAVNCAFAAWLAKAANINVAVSIDLMTNRAPLKRAQLSTSDWSVTARPWFKGLGEDPGEAALARLEGWAQRACDHPSRLAEDGSHLRMTVIVLKRRKRT
jgi:hypothetical protein